MASQTLKNRHCAKQRQSGTTTFVDLPDELLLNILQHTDVTAVLRLRETSKSVVPACTEAIKDKLKILYVHPSPSSVQRAISICRSHLSSEVKEICFVSKKFHVSNDHDYNHCSGGLLELPWPVREPLQEDVSRKTSWEGAHIISKFQSSFRELLSSPTALKITTFSFTEACDKPGFNMISTQRIANWRKTILSAAPSEQRKAEDKYHAARSRFRSRFQFANIDALASVLSDPRFTFTRLKVTHELAHAGCAFDRSMPYIGNYRALTHVELTVSHGVCRSPSERHYRDFLDNTAGTLIELKIGIQYSHPIPIDPNPHRESGLTCVFHLPELPQLRHLELHRLPSPDLKAIIGAGHNNNAFMVQQVDLGKFLKDRCPKLQFLQLTDLVPVIGFQWPPKPWTMADAVLQDFGSFAGEIEGLDANTRAWEIDFPA